MHGPYVPGGVVAPSHSDSGARDFQFGSLRLPDTRHYARPPSGRLVSLRRAIRGILAALLLAACGGAPGKAMAPLPTHPASDDEPSEGAELTGTLEANGETGVVCIWVVADSGHRNAVIWPRGYEARTVDGEVALVDGGGEVVAVAGEPLSLGGGFRDTDELPDSCAGDSGGYFAAGRVKAAD